MSEKPAPKDEELLVRIKVRPYNYIGAKDADSNPIYLYMLEPSALVLKALHSQGHSLGEDDMKKLRAEASATPAAERTALEERIETIERIAVKIQLDMHGMRNPKTEKQVRVYNSIIQSLTTIRETCGRNQHTEKSKSEGGMN